jgi:hypothetical protein
MIQVNMGCCDASAVEFAQDHMLLLREYEWIIKSQKNKAKVKSFKLEHKRSLTVQVYPNGKVIVMIKCSSRPFKLHEDDGSREFFETIGEVKRILIQQFRQHSIIPPTGEWLVKEYDRDVTIPESDLVKKYPQISHWYSKEGIQLRTLGLVFQIYGKIMPICGRCLRFEDKVGIKEDIPLEQGIEQAIERPLEIIAAFELHEKMKRDKSIHQVS